MQVGVAVAIEVALAAARALVAVVAAAVVVVIAVVVALLAYLHITSPLALVPSATFTIHATTSHIHRSRALGPELKPELWVRGTRPSVDYIT